MTRPAADDVTSPHPLVESHWVDGTRLYDPQGTPIGTIRI